MDFGLLLTCLFFWTLFENIALEKTKRNIDKFVPFILKPASITDNKVVNKDYSFKPGHVFPTRSDNISKPSKKAHDTSEQKEPKEQETKKVYKSTYHKYDPDCPDCNNDTKKRYDSKPEVNYARKPINEKSKNVRKVKEMKIEKPYIIHNDHVTDKVKTNTKPEIIIPNDILGAMVKPNGNVESQNDNEIKKVPNGISDKYQSTVCVEAAPVFVTPSPDLNLVKIENDYHMKEYKELYHAPYYSYSPHYPYNQHYCYNQHNCYNSNQNNGCRYNQNSVGYQKPLSKVWRTVSYTTRKNGDIISQQYSTYSPEFHNNCYIPGSEQIGGYAYYYNHNIY